MNSAEDTVARARESATAWAQNSVGQRLELMHRLRREIVVALDEITRAVQQDVQKPDLDIVGGDILVVLEALKYYGSRAKNILAPKNIGGGGALFFDTHSREEFAPMGTVLILAPWNYPFQLAILPVITALIAGNAVVLKGSEYAPRTTQIIAELFKRVGLPAGLLTIVTGGPEVGEALVRAKPDKIFLTGSTPTARRILALAAEQLTPVSLELGGKDACVVLDDADLKAAERATLFGAFNNAGQVCVSAKRLLLAKSVAADFLKSLVPRAAALRFDQGVSGDYGPLVRRAEVERIRALVEDAVAKGARLETELRMHENFVAPIILSGVPSHARLYREEVFGPVLCVEEFTTDAEAIRLANDCDYGLGACVFSRDIPRARKLAAQITVGHVSINDSLKTVGHPAAPFGGEKWSGMGRYHGAAGLYAFSRQKTVHVSKSTRFADFSAFPLNTEKLSTVKKILRLRHGARWAWLQKVLPLLMVLGGALRAESNLTLQVVVQGLVAQPGKLAYALFAEAQAAGFPTDKTQALQRGFRETSGAEDLAFEIADLPPGAYAVAVFQDLDGNGVLKKNFLGIPREPIGHSQNPVLRFGPPSFSRARFTLDAATPKILIRMVKK